MQDVFIWTTPDGPITARVHERYVGLRGQPRVALVDAMGRVHHYDAALISQAPPATRGAAPALR